MPAGDEDPARALLNLARDFKALANPVRLRILSLLMHAELSAVHVQQVLGISEAAARRQLNYLRRARLVESSRGTYWACFRLCSASSELRNRLFDAIAAQQSTLSQFAEDLERWKVIAS